MLDGFMLHQCRHWLHVGYRPIPSLISEEMQKTLFYNTVKKETISSKLQLVVADQKTKNIKISVPL